MNQNSSHCTKQEQIKLLKQYQEHYNIEIRNQLIITNLYLIDLVIAKDFNTSKYEYGDLFSAGVIGLINFIDHFNTFSIANAKQYIKRHIIYYIAKQNKLEYLEIMSNNHLFSKNDLSIEEKLEIDDMLNCLNERNKEVVQLYFGLINNNFYTLEEIGQKYGINRSRVHQILQESIKTLKRKNKKYFSSK